MTIDRPCEASPIKSRATKVEMEARAVFLIDYARANHPVTVRQLFYAATVAAVPGIDKSEAGYSRVQVQVLKLRQSGRLPYHWIADGTRWMIAPETFDGWEDALRSTARTYRKSLWSDAEYKVEIWLEKDALAGVLHPVVDAYDVALAPTRGYTSESFAYSSVAGLRGGDRGLWVYALYDCDRSGQDAANSLKEKVFRFGESYDVPVVFEQLGLSPEQVAEWGLPTRAPKTETAADRRWPHDFAAELDAIPPDTLRTMVAEAIENHLPRQELEHLKRVEAEERRTLREFIGGWQ